MLWRFLPDVYRTCWIYLRLDAAVHFGTALIGDCFSISIAYVAAL